MPTRRLQRVPVCMPSCPSIAAHAATIHIFVLRVSLSFCQSWNTFWAMRPTSNTTLNTVIASCHSYGTKTRIHCFLCGKHEIT